MDMYKFKFSALQQNIFRLLCIKVGMSLNQRETAELLGVSPTAVAKAIRKIEKAGFARVLRSKRMNLVSIELNKDNRRAMELKRVENLKMIYESGLAEFLEERFPGAAIVLFGSFSRGDDTIKSDIDIAIIGCREKKTDLSEFEKGLERSVSLHFYSSLREINKELRENICNGVVLAGGIEL